MSKENQKSNIVFTKQIQGFGTIELRPFSLTEDIVVLHHWVNQPYAKFWGMLNSSYEQVYEEYQNLISRPEYEVFMGVYESVPIFLMEKYKASHDRIAKYYTTKETDYGMHVLVAPAKQKKTGFTWNVFRTIMDYFFSLKNIERVVVEPDVNNEKIDRKSVV